MLRRWLPIISWALCSLAAHGQRHDAPDLIHIRFEPVMGNLPLKLYEGSATDSLRITAFRCYVSHLAFKNTEEVIARDSKEAHLLDASDPESLRIRIPTHRGRASIDTMMFLLGIDSFRSCSGAHGGDLDPAKGMYWAWQSGYINVKLEGISPVSTARKHAFHFHLGGYAVPNVAIQKIALAVPHNGEMVVEVDIAQFLTGIDLAKQNSVMIPGPEAVRLSEKAAQIFHIRH